MEQVEMLAFIFVDPFYLNIKHCMGIKLHSLTTGKHGADILLVVELHPRGAVRQHIGPIPITVFRVAPMPDPVSRYHVPEADTGSASVLAQSDISFLCVPESSPR